LSPSQSIKSITFSDCELGGPILQSFDIPNLKKVKFENGFCVKYQAASAIRRSSGLQHHVLLNGLDFYTIPPMSLMQ
jgi:hypothetical protein